MGKAQGAFQPRAHYHRKGVVQSDLIAFVVLLVFVAVVVAVDTLLKPDLSGPLLILVGLALAMVPAALWLFMFYQLDSAEPEPVHNVVKIFVVGLALASAAGIPLTDQLFRVQEWLYRNTTLNILGSVFIIGGVETFIVYATVRFFMYDEPEFDERADGVIYGTAAGLGYATALNLQFILTNRSIALGPGEIYVAGVALAHAAFAGFLGYFLGKDKMQRMPVWWLSLGFMLAMLLNGVFFVLRGELDTGSITIGSSNELPPFTGLILAGVLAIAMSLLDAFLIRRDVLLTLAGKMPLRPADATVGDRQANWAVVGAFAVTLAIGALVWNGAVNGTTSFDTNGIRGAYPSYYTGSPGDGEILHVSDSSGNGAEFIITADPLNSGETTETIVLGLAAQRGSRAAVYKVLETRQITVNGKPAMLQRFSAVTANNLGHEAPELVEGVDTILVVNGRAVVITLMTTPGNIAEVMPLYTRFVNSLSFS